MSSELIEQNGASDQGKFLTFTLAGEEYGISIMKVKEIIGLMPITELPQTPEHIKGVINLRGKVIPVMDLRLRFSLAAAENTERTCIIVVETTDEQGRQLLAGLIIDAVSEVISLKAGEIESAPNLHGQSENGVILGLAKYADSVKILLNIDMVFQSEDLPQMEAVDQ
ncbi:chemotaxis protein CheW [bacterium]|nr:chemotaxis protein CheW [bacterium]